MRFALGPTARVITLLAIVGAVAGCPSPTGTDGGSETGTSSKKSPKPKTTPSVAVAGTESTAPASALPSAVTPSAAASAATPASVAPSALASTATVVSTAPSTATSVAPSAAPSVAASTAPLTLAQSVTISTVAGKGDSGEDKGGYAEGLGADAEFRGPTAVIVDKDGNLLVADAGNHRIRKVTFSGATATVSTFAGSSANQEDEPPFDTANPLEARFRTPTGLAYDKVNNIVYVADTGNHCIRKIAANGEVTTIAGSKEPGTAARGEETNGAGLSVKFNAPRGLVLDGNTLYVADAQNDCIRAIDVTTNMVTTLAGGESGLLNGTGTEAQFFVPYGIAMDASKNLLVVENLNNRVRQITTPAAVVTIFAGPGVNVVTDVAGYIDGPVADAKFNFFQSGGGIAVGGPDNAVYVADASNHRIRKIVGGKVDTLAGSGLVTGTSNEGAFAEGPGNSAKFYNPIGLAVAADGTVYVADRDNHRIRKIKKN